tara:strand:- start:957 stop:2282 length:1326 start_codon:yes stop_codon:yes gene_type:complete
MIEISQIIFQFFILLILFSFPITPYVNQQYLTKYNFNIFSIICLNIIINLNAYLILSTFIVNINLLFFINFFLAVTALIFNYKKNFFVIKSSDWKLLLLFFTINICIFISLAEDPRLNWDGIVQWLPKATTYFQGLGYTNVGAQTYPHLGGFLWGYFWKNNFLETEYIGRFFYVFFYLISIFSLNNYIKTSHKFKFIIVSIFLLSTISLTYDEFLFGGYQDTLLFAVLLVASKLLYLIIIKNKKDFFILLLYFLTAFICCWIKQEGFVYFVILTFVILFFEKNNKNKFYFFILILLFSLIYFYIKNFLIGSVQFDQKINFEVFQSLNFILIKEIILSMSLNLVSAIMKYPLWIFILFFILRAFFLNENFSKLKYVYSFFVLNFLFILLVIFYSCLNLGLDSCGLIMRVSMDRIMYQTSGFYLIWIIYIFYNSNFFSQIRSI